MMFRMKLFRNAVAASGLGLLLLPVPNPIAEFVSGVVPALHAQRFPDRRQALEQLRGIPPGQRPPGMPGSQPAAPVTPPAAQQQQPQPAQQTDSLPPSMLNQPAQPAEIHFTATTLSIHAVNSSLSEILHAVSTQSGMELQGLGGDERVFGNFGPGNPHDVLSQLLNGTPYNVLMVGDLSDGAPRELILTPAQTMLETAQGISPPPPAATDHIDEGDSSEAEDDAGPEKPKTPQQLYQELQEMRAHQHPPQ